MKLAVIGGGSTYSPELADGLARRAQALGLTTLSMFDLDAERLSVVGAFVKRMVEPLAPRLEVLVHAQLEAALDGADFVVVQIRVGGQQARHRDEQLAMRRGLLGQETTGLGGFLKAMRTVPALLEITATMERCAPRAMLINFTNPVSIVTEAILNHSSVNAIGLCNIPIGLRMDLAKLLDMPAHEIVLDSVGLNHLSFVRRVMVDGEDVLPPLLERVMSKRAGHPVNIPELDYPRELISALGMIPSDYLRYFFLQTETLQEQTGKAKTRAQEVLAIEDELLAHYADTNNHEKPAALEKRGGAFYSHAAIELIEAIAGDTGAELVVDVLNRGAVAELPQNAVIEVPCKVGRSGAEPLPQRPLEPEIRGIIQHVKAYEELTVEAAVRKDRNKALLALSSHPLIPSVALATEIIDEIADELKLA